MANAWAVALQAVGDHLHRADLAVACDKVFEGVETGYQKAIIIQAAGKAANPNLDAHALQLGAGRAGSWDAREFAKQVFVPWNSGANLPFSHAGDPYVSNPYRIPRFDASVRAQRQRPREFDAALTVIDVLDAANSRAEAQRNLEEILYALRRFIADRAVDYPLPNRASLDDVMRCIGEFISSRSGGARLQAVVLALISALASQGMAYADIRSRHVNAADKGSGAAGDVTFAVDGRASAIEVKDRALTKAEFDATVEKCRIANARELLFVIRAQPALAPDLSAVSFADICRQQFSSGLNVYLEQFDVIARIVLTLVGEAGRRAFLEAVGSGLAAQNADVTHKWAWAALVKAI